MRYLQLMPVLVFFLLPTLVKGQIVKWAADRPLTVKDFKYKPDYGEEGTGAVIFSYTVYYYEWNVRDSTYIVTFPKLETIFDPSRSWVKISQLTNDYLLGHEQLHFDITELHTRKMAIALRSATYTKNFKAEIEAIAGRINTDRDAMQSRYDKESRHGNDPNMQFRWQLYVYLQLLKLPRDF